MSDPNGLRHYGVKGMRWGVRKDHYRTYKEHATVDTQHNVLKRTGSKVQMVRYFAEGQKLKSGQNYTEEWYNNAATGKQFIEKGSTLNRVVRGVDENALAGRLYVSRLQSDADMYKAVIPAIQSKRAFGKKEYHSVYEVQLETKKRLSMPSEKERIDTFIETIQTPTGREWLKNNGYKGQIDELNAKEVGLNYYKRFNKYAGDQSSKINDAYFNSIKAKGYDALLDDNDAGVWSKQPTILLGAKGTVRVTQVKQLSAADINAAQMRVLKSRQFKSK